MAGGQRRNDSERQVTGRYIEAGSVAPQRVDANAGSGRHGKEGHALRNLFVIALTRLTRTSIIWEGSTQRADRRANRQSIPEGIAIAAHATDVVRIEIS
jgi:hypothetical protein